MNAEFYLSSIHRCFVERRRQTVYKNWNWQRGWSAWSIYFMLFTLYIIRGEQEPSNLTRTITGLTMRIDVN